VLAASGLFCLYALKDEATKSDIACQRAPVAIGELILPELCGDAPNQRLSRTVGEKQNARFIATTSWLRAREPTTNGAARSGFACARPFAEVISIFLYPDG
jgi:hypothetical protein